MTKKVAIIIVEFPDKQFTELIQANTTFQKLKEYYNEVSYGKLQLDNITFFTTVFYNGGSTKTLTWAEEVYRMLQEMSYYGQDTHDTLAQLSKTCLKKQAAQ